MPEWSAYQTAIFEHVVRSSNDLVVQAYAGCGKTTTIIKASESIQGRRVAMTAFNTKIAEILRAKVRSAYVATFHSVGRRTLGQAFGDLELDRDKVDKLCREAGISDFATRRAMCKVAEICKNALVVTGPVLATERSEILGRMDAVADDYDVDLPPAVEKREVFFEAVLQLLEESMNPDNMGTIDFNDMVWLPVVLKLRVNEYDTLFVDELQDMNATQLALILKMRAGGKIVAVGDANQAIYGFRGAQSEAVDWLAGLLKADRLELPVSYRCARSIIRVAQALVPEIQARPDAPEGHVGDVSLDHMLKGAQPGDFVLSRTNAPLIVTCLQLLSAGVPSRIQGKDIGKNLTSFIRNSRTHSVAELRDFVQTWRSDEIVRLQQERRSPQAVIDRAECLFVLSDGAATVNDVVQRVESLFDDDRPGVVCSTIHKAKGLEADRVWLLGTSFAGCHYWTQKQVQEAGDTPALQRAMKRVREENNILYVGITRAKNELFGVQGIPRPLEGA